MKRLIIFLCYLDDIVSYKLRSTNMKHIIAILFMLIPLCHGMHAQEIRVTVDERMELVCIAARLAGYEEYVCDSAPEYMKDIDTAGHRDDRLIGFLRELRESDEIAYDAISESVLALKIIEDGHIVLDEKETDCIISHDDRWSKASFGEYAALLDRFYRKSRFHDFFREHSGMYEKAREYALPYLKDIDMNQFPEYFGGRARNLTVCLGLSIGLSNYGLSDIYDGDQIEDEDILVVIGCGHEKDGVPTFANDRVVPVIIHEICHAYTKDLARGCYPMIAESMEKVFNEVKDRIISAHALPSIMANEFINELFVIQYMLDNENLRSYAMYHAAENQENGYFWMWRAVEFMRNFSENRDKFPTARDFMPHLVDFCNRLPLDWPVIRHEFDTRHPYVVGTFPVNGCTVSADTDEIRILFSRDMKTSAWGSIPVEGTEVLKGEFEWTDCRTLTVRLSEPLVPGRTYGIALLWYSCIALNGHRLEDNYEITFTVK